MEQQWFWIRGLWWNYVRGLSAIQLLSILSMADAALGAASSGFQGSDNWLVFGRVGAIVPCRKSVVSCIERGRVQERCGWFMANSKWRLQWTFSHEPPAVDEAARCSSSLGWRPSLVHFHVLFVDEEFLAFANEIVAFTHRRNAQGGKLGTKAYP